MEGKSIRSHNP